MSAPGRSSTLRGAANPAIVLAMSSTRDYFRDPSGSLPRLVLTAGLGGLLLLLLRPARR